MGNPTCGFSKAVVCVLLSIVVFLSPLGILVSCDTPFHNDLFGLAGTKNQQATISGTTAPSATPTATPTVTTTPTPAAPAAPVIAATLNQCTTAVTITLTEATAGAQIYYTLDGSLPTTSSAQATSGTSFNINCDGIILAPASAVTVQAIAYQSSLASTVTSQSVAAVTLHGGPNDPAYNPGYQAVSPDTAQINLDGIIPADWVLYGSSPSPTILCWSDQGILINGTFASSFLSPSGLAQIGVGHDLKVYNGNAALDSRNRTFTFHVNVDPKNYQQSIAVNLRDSSGWTNHSEYIPVAPGWNTIQLTTDGGGYFQNIPVYGNNAFHTASYVPTDAVFIWFVLAAPSAQIGQSGIFRLDSISWE